MKRKPLITLFAVFCAFSCPFAFSACGEERGTEGLEYELNEDGNSYSVKVGNDLSLIGEKVVIPPTYNGKPVTAIGDSAFRFVYAMESIKLPDSITYIGFDAFFDCRNMKKINIPDSVTYIGSRAFERCTYLSEISFPDTVKHIGESVLYNTAYYFNEDNWQGNELYNNRHLIALKEAATDNYEIKDGTLTIAGGLFKENVNLTGIKIADSVTTIGSYAFQGCTKLKNIDIPQSVTSIGNDAFRDCKSIESLALPYNITSIDSFTFNGCTNLKNITLPEGLTSIGGWAFNECINLENISVPNSIITIGGSAFRWCHNLNYNIYDNARYLGDNANPYTALIEIIIETEPCTINENTKILAGNSFSRFEGSEITIPDNIISINDTAFDSCENLTELTIPDSVKFIGSSAFQHCSKLESIVIPNSINQINSYLFSYCTNLKSVTIPKSVTLINAGAFLECVRLADIYYTGSEQDWKNVTIMNENEKLSEATIHYNF